MSNIELDENDLWIPIHDTYKGTFDGNGYSLKYKINVPGTTFPDKFIDFGFFEAASCASFMNLRIFNSSMSATAQYSYQCNSFSRTVGGKGYLMKF